MIESTPVADTHDLAAAEEFLSRRRLALPRLALALSATLLVMVAAVAIGPADIPPDATLRILLSHLPGVQLDSGLSQAWRDIIWEVRVPRILAAGLVGSTLAMAGVTYQGVFRNPLAEPYLLGVASG
ncbi:MAG TPA: iron chelate uptake ABC transporter family permease subunit, partial [Dehalococcoidia bacterium]|nr:iron chelate uptake ABC transporter family permease subunit [Dehalococcoidia bacterium]